MSDDSAQALSALRVLSFSYTDEHAGPRPLRVVLVDHEPWFVAVDVVQLLPDATMDTIWTVEPCDVLKVSQDSLQSGWTALRAGHDGTEPIWLLSEFGVHDIVATQQPRVFNRVRFKRWMMRDVIPTVGNVVPSVNYRTNAPHRVRTVKLSSGLLPPAQPQSLYRLYSTDGDLLYVGVSLGVASRMSAHRSAQPWWHEVASITLEGFPDRRAVLDAERAAIKTEDPRYNIV